MRDRYSLLCQIPISRVPEIPHLNVCDEKYTVMNTSGHMVHLHYAMSENPHDDTGISRHPYTAMTSLTVDQIIEIHAGVIAQDGGDERVLSEAALHQMVFLANRIPDVYRRAAFALYSLCAYPPFRDGNERTAQSVAELVLGQENLHITPGDDCTLPLIAGIAAYTVEPEDIERVLRDHAH